MVVDTAKLMQRLEAIRNLLLLEDEDAIQGQLTRLEQAQSLPAVAEVIGLLVKQDWGNAQIRISEILARGMAVVEYQDQELAALRLEAMALEAELMGLATEQAELERLIRDFDRRQYEALGDVLAECLRLRREVLHLQASKSGKAEDRSAEQEAREEYEEYQQARAEAEQEPQAHILDAEAQTELKRLYKAACQRCHPDRVGDEDKAAAQAVFIQVQDAFRQSDLEALHRIHAVLDQKNPFANPIRTSTEKLKLEQNIARLALQVANLIHIIRGLRASETYRTLAGISDWAVYFATARQHLEAECESLSRQLDEACHD